MAESLTFILLRGLTREQRHWGEFPSLLQAHFPESQIITPDLPGCGSRCQEISPTQIPDITESVRAQLPTLSNHRYLFIGLSLGAMVCIDWLSRHPEECAGAVLINTSLRGINPLYYRLRPANLPSLARSMLEMDPVRREARILAMTSANYPKDQAIIQAWATYVRQQPVSRANALRQLLAAARFVAPNERPGGPLLLLNGVKDRLVNPACSQQIAEHWHTPLRQHPTAGHDLPLDAPQWVVEQIVQWIGEP